MAFRFDFQLEENEEERGRTEEIESNLLSPSFTSPENQNEVLQISPPEVKVNQDDFETTIVTFSVKEREGEDRDIQREIQLVRLIEFDESEFDLIPGQYEGTLFRIDQLMIVRRTKGRIWECSIDLVGYIFENFSNDQGIIGSKTVLELGCGHGLPGVAALKCGFGRILFSDFNDDVLLDNTWPTILMNIPSEQINPSTIGCVSGDWMALSQSLLQGTLPYPVTYDLILSAETLYNLAAVQKVYQFLLHHLSADGIALIASKRYYFGVGGGVRDFLHLISQSTSPLSATVVKVFDDAKSNIREIVEVRRRT